MLRLKVYIALLVLGLELPVLGIAPDQKLLSAITQMKISRDREPGVGGVRITDDLTDIRSTWDGADGKEMAVTVWSPRVHPFVVPPTYKKTRPCLQGKYYETTVGIEDLNKTQILRVVESANAPASFPAAYEWNDSTAELLPIRAPKEAPQKWELLGIITENLKTGICRYQPGPLPADQSARTYFQKHLTLSKNTNVTDLVFPKMTWDLISGTQEHFGADYLLQLDHLKDLAIDFSEGTLLLPPNKGAFLFQHAHRTAIERVKLEWAKPQGSTLEGLPSYSGPTIHGFYASKENNQDLWFDHITLSRVPGSAFYFDTVRGAVVSHSTLLSPLEDNALPSAREGAVRAIHSQDIVVRNNQFHNLGGDGISLHGQFAIVTTEPYLSTTPTPETPASLCVALGSSWGTYSEGEVLGFLNEKMTYLGEMKIQSVKNFLFTDSNRPDYCKNYAQCSHVCFTSHPDFTPVKNGFATSLTKNPNLFLIQGNKISQVKGRGIVAQGSNGILSDNEINHTAGPGIALAADLAHQLQGPGAYNVLLRNNRLEFVAEDNAALEPGNAVLGGLTLAATKREADGRVLLWPAPLIQQIRIEGSRSLIDNAGSVALEIASAKTVDIKLLSIGTSGFLRNPSSGSLSGAAAEGSVLITKAQEIDLSGLTSPALLDEQQARNRTLVVDPQYVSRIKLPVISRGIRGKTAHTLWYTTFRNAFREELDNEPQAIRFSIQGAQFSSPQKSLPVEFFSVVTPRVGDKEEALLGERVSLSQSANRWEASGLKGILSPSRVQLRPKYSQRILDLSLSIETIYLAPKKRPVIPVEG